MVLANPPISEFLENSGKMQKTTPPPPTGGFEPPFRNPGSAPAVNIFQSCCDEKAFPRGRKRLAEEVTEV